MSVDGARPYPGIEGSIRFEERKVLLKAPAALGARDTFVWREDTELPKRNDKKKKKKKMRVSFLQY